jgi:hypothetical protein
LPLAGGTMSGNTTYAIGKGEVYSSNPSGTITVEGSAVATTSYVLHLPNAQGGANSVLTNDGGGNLTWTTPAAALTGGTGISVSGGQINLATPVATANGGTGVNASSAANGQLLIGNGAGFTLATLTAGSGITVTSTAGGISLSSSGGNPVGSPLASTDIWVGNPGGTAAAVAMTGDVTISNAGATTVGKLQGVTMAVSGGNAPTTSGQVLRYNGTQWQPNFVAMTDLRSTVTGSNQFGSTCTSSQTLTYNTVGDVMSCQNISVTATNFGTQTKNTF